MASISTDGRGNRRILFIDSNGKRKSIRLGKLSLKAAEVIKIRVEHLVAGTYSQCGIDPETARWVSTIGDDLADKLAAVGLIQRRGRTALGPFVAEYIKSRERDAKKSTICNLRQAERFLLAHFKADVRMTDITPGDADDFRRYVESKVGINTARRMLGRAKQFFRAATRKHLIFSNPFADMKGLTVQENRTREVFVSREVAEKVLAQCTSNEWRLIFALARFGGLRTPSEPRLLKWSDIDWAGSKFRVTSVKTERYEEHQERWVPIFPELLPYLNAAYFDEATKGATVITRKRGHKNWATQIKRFIKAAGLKPWGKIFQNMRSTRETELLEIYPVHVVCAWLGNSPKIAMKHYAQVTDEHFHKAAQKQAQHPSEPLCIAPISAPPLAENAAFAANSDNLAPRQGERTIDVNAELPKSCDEAKNKAARK